MFPDVELIREAARLMRVRAEAATQGRWEADAETVSVAGEIGNVCEAFGLADKWPNAQHIASWDPAVALAVADWLDIGANPYACVDLEPMVRVARAYLRLCSCTVDPDGARNMDGCPTCDLPPCGFLVGEVA